MSAIKNGIKELHCKESSYIWKKFKKSIAHNNSKLTCNIYHIQVLSSPFSKRVYWFTSKTDSGDEILKSFQTAYLDRRCFRPALQIHSFGFSLFLGFDAFLYAHPIYGIRRITGKASRITWEGCRASGGLNKLNV